jgi:DNA-binding MarR family transcriptional regulator
MGPAAAAERGGRRAGSEAEDAWKLFLRLFESERPRVMALYRESGLTPPQLMTLRRVGQEGAMPMRDVAQWLACDASNVTGIVDRLEERGFLKRRPSADDRRVTMLELTAKGTAIARKLSERMSVPPEALKSLSGSDQRQLREILERALDTD